MFRTDQTSLGASPKILEKSKKEFCARGLSQARRNIRTGIRVAGPFLRNSPTMMMTTAKMDSYKWEHSIRDTAVPRPSFPPARSPNASNRRSVHASSINQLSSSIGRNKDFMNRSSRLCRRKRSFTTYYDHSMSFLSSTFFSGLSSCSPDHPRSMPPKKANHHHNI